MDCEDLSGSLRSSQELAGALRSSRVLSGALERAQEPWMVLGALECSQELSLSGALLVSQELSTALGSSRRLSGALDGSQELSRAFCDGSQEVWGALRRSRGSLELSRVSEALESSLELSTLLWSSRGLSGALLTL